MLELKLATSSDCYLRGSLANITGRASTFIDRPVKRKQCAAVALAACHATRRKQWRTHYQFDGGS